MNIKRQKFLNVMLVITSLFGYLEWGGGNNGFLFQLEMEIIFKMLSSPKEIFHPFIIIPLLGQCLLVFTLFQKSPSRKLTVIAILFLGLILYLIAFIGCIETNVKVILSSVPFIGFSLYTLYFIYKNKSQVKK